MTFMDAVKQLADEVGLELPKPDPETQARQERASGLQDVMEAAAKHFQHNLQGLQGAEARDYLSKREISATSIADFRIGYAPDGRKNLERALGHVTQEQLIEAGLLISVEDKEPYDRFRKRIMVPIKDPRGRVIAFGGRILGEGEPKYLNSPDTSLFDKGRVLFNLDRAGPASRQAGRIIVVEGYFDVIALDKAGIREAVAPMGTALTETQLELLWRLVDAPILCFDGDSAGQHAAQRAAERAMANLRPGKQLLFVLLPQGRDPDDVIRDGGSAAFEASVEQALPLSTFLYRSEAAKIDRERPEQRAALRQRLEELAQSCSDRIVAEEFARSLRAHFFEDFGWKQNQRQAIAGAIIRTSARNAPDLNRLYVRSALYGLTRFPMVAADHLEALSKINVVQSDLRRWRDAIGEAVTINPELDDDGVVEIIEANCLPETLQYEMRNDLRFSFTRPQTDRERAIKQLETLVTFLAQESDLDEHMTKLNDAAIQDAGGDRYLAIENQRQQLREARAALLESGAQWDEWDEEAA